VTCYRGHRAHCGARMLYLGRVFVPLDMNELAPNHGK